MPPKASAAAAAGASADEVAAQIERIDLSAAATAPTPAPAPASAASAAAPASTSASATGAPVQVSAEDAATVDRCAALLLALLDKLDQECTEALTSTVVVDAARLGDYTEMVSHAVTKFVLFSSQGDAAALPSLSEELSNHLSGVSCVLRSLLAAPAGDAKLAGPGATQRGAIVAVHRALMASVRTVVVQLRAHLLAKQLTKLNPALTAQVWDVLDKQLRAVPLTNATAVGRLVLQQCGVMRDAANEIAQLKLAPSDAKAAKGKDDDDDEDDEDEDDEDDFDDLDDEDDDVLSAEEYALVPASGALVQLAQQLLKGLYMYVLKARMPEDEANVAWLEGALERARTVCTRVDDVAAAMGDERAVALAAVDALVKELRAAALSVVQQHRTMAGAVWPMGAAAAAAAAAPADAAAEAAPAYASCAACSATVAAGAPAAPAAGAAAAAAAVDPALDWLQKVVAMLHKAHADVEAAAAAAPVAQ